MEFWGVEVKPGKPLKIEAEDGYMIHVSQAALGESKNGKNECVPLYVKTDGGKFVMGTLISEKVPQINLDIFFEKDFELSHNWKNGSVFILGYKSPDMDGGDDELYSDFDDSEDEEIPVDLSMTVKPNSTELKEKKEQKAKVEEAKNGGESESEDDEDDDGDADEDDESDSDADEMGLDSDDEDDSDDEEEDEEEETPKKVEPPSKKRPNGSAVTKPASKKAKTGTPQKTDGKKGSKAAVPNVAKSRNRGSRR